MMHKQWSVLLVGFLLVFAWQAQAIDQFKIKDLKGKCQVKIGDKTEDAVANKDYPVGATVITPADGSAVVELAPDNTVSVDPKTTVIVGSTKNTKLLRLVVATGKITVKTTHLPDGQKVEVQAVTLLIRSKGSIYTTKVEQSSQADGRGFDSAPTKVTLTNTEGVLGAESINDVGGRQVFGQELTIKSLSQGGEAVVLLGQGMHHNYAKVTVPAGTMEFSVGGQTFKVTGPANFEFAVPNGATNAGAVVMKVSSGSVDVLNPDGTTRAALDATAGSSLISTKDVQKNNDLADNYLAGAMKETRLYAKWYAAKNDPKTTPEQLKALEDEMKQAATDTSGVWVQTIQQLPQPPTFTPVLPPVAPGTP